MILNSNNSPFSLKLSNTISLGKTAEDLLTISKYNDKDYFQKIKALDKNSNIPPHLEKKLKGKASIPHGKIILVLYFDWSLF